MLNQRVRIMQVTEQRNKLTVDDVLDGDNERRVLPINSVVSCHHHRKHSDRRITMTHQCTYTT